MSKRPIKPGPIAKAYQPSRAKYSCPVKKCDKVMRGDDIGKHFRNNSNFIALDKANENLQSLRKNKSLEAILYRLPNSWWHLTPWS